MDFYYFIILKRGIMSIFFHFNPFYSSATDTTYFMIIQV